MLQEIEDAAGSTGRSLKVALARNLDDLEPAFTQLVSAQVDVSVTPGDPLDVKYAQLRDAGILTGAPSRKRGVLFIPEAFMDRRGLLLATGKGRQFSPAQIQKAIFLIDKNRSFVNKSLTFLLSPDAGHNGHCRVE